MTEFFSVAREYGPYLLEGVWITVQMTILGMVGALILGLATALGLMSGFRPLVWLCRIYVEIIRGTPMVVQLFLVYFGLAGIGIVLAPLVAASLTFAVLGGAFAAEIFRAGINAVDPGQSDAAKAMGMNQTTMMRYIIVPQAIRVVLPPIANESIQMLKATSIVVTIGVADITFRAYNVASTTFRSLPILTLAALIYFCLAYPMSVGVRYMERRLRRED